MYVGGGGDCGGGGWGGGACLCSVFYFGKVEGRVAQCLCGVFRVSEVGMRKGSSVFTHTHILLK